MSSWQPIVGPWSGKQTVPVNRRQDLGGGRGFGEQDSSEQIQPVVQATHVSLSATETERMHLAACQPAAL
ncbi:hypothetical protein EYF80_027566 [Liparis tanakae]|uniref:Uncharacterized protein n=1 Tax=Liparis tanakae TaxID=230148 RepID=A0A4Z2H8T2_9TELE|nr:hypothetical protein EYF80_027566 [Liparis tanakae]